jgi:hypothetical protein
MDRRDSIIREEDKNKKKGEKNLNVYYKHPPLFKNVVFLDGFIII